MCCSQLCTFHMHMQFALYQPPRGNHQQPRSIPVKTLKTEQPQQQPNHISPFFHSFHFVTLLHGQLKAISSLGKGCYFRHWINHNTHKAVWINAHSYHKGVGCLFLLDFFCGTWSGSLCRAWTCWWRIYKRLIHDSEADLFPNVHVKVMGPFFCLIFPHPHLLCFITGHAKD